MRRALVLAASMLVALTVLPAGAGAEVTRESYKAAVEPICATNSAAAKGILAGVREKIRRGKLAPAGRQFVRASNSLRGTLVELRGVPRPGDAEEVLATWLQRIGTQASLLQKTGQALIAGNRSRAGKLVTQLSNGARRINALVVSFEFRHCRFDTAQYT